MFLAAWCAFSAIVLALSLIAHASTFLGIDPMAKFPGVMFIHVAIFPPFFAAIYYANRVKDTKEGPEIAMKAAPRPFRWLTGIFGAYALLNFILFIILNEGGNPYKEDGKYLLKSHGTVIRQLTELEFHRHQAYIVRGFSGHWMLFATAALTMLIGVRNIRRRNLPIPPPASPTPAETAELLEQDPRPQPTTFRAGVVVSIIYILCLLLILSGRPVFCLAAAIPTTIAGIFAIRQRFGFPRKAFQSVIGCLCVFPNFFLASWMGKFIAEFIYLAIYVGLAAAITGETRILSPKSGPAQLSDGTLLHNRVWSGLMFFVQFPIIIFGGLGLTHMAEHIGRYIEIRRRQPPQRWD
jgi:hypothetical protein